MAFSENLTFSDVQIQENITIRFSETRWKKIKIYRIVINFFCIDMKIPFCAPSREILQLLHTFCYIIPGHPDKPGLHGKNAATQQLKPLEFAQCLLTGSLLQGNSLKDIGLLK